MYTDLKEIISDRSSQRMRNSICLTDFLCPFLSPENNDVWYMHYLPRPSFSVSQQVTPFCPLQDSPQSTLWSFQSSPFGQGEILCEVGRPFRDLVWHCVGWNVWMEARVRFVKSIKRGKKRKWNNMSFKKEKKKNQSKRRTVFRTALLSHPWYLH